MATTGQTEVMQRIPVLDTIRGTSEWSGYPAAILYEMAARGLPGFVRNGRNIRVHREAFEGYLRQQAAGNDDRTN